MAIWDHRENRRANPGRRLRKVQLPVRRNTRLHMMYRGIRVTVAGTMTVTIYPRVVGDSVGLPPLYTLIAAMIGGKLFGILGILFFIPLMAVAVELVKEDAEQRLQNRKGLSPN